MASNNDPLIRKSDGNEVSRDRNVPSLSDVRELGRATLQGTKSYVVKSKNTDRAFLIDVARPALPVTEGQTVPVVYVLDGNGAFGLAAQTIQMLQLGGSLPSMIVVGVGYSFDRARNPRVEHAERRGRDFSPAVDQMALERTRAAFAAEGLDGDIQHGGASAFLSFLIDEVKPFVASRYPVDIRDQTLVGMSLGGLFALHALFAAPAAFNRVVVVSPALWWNKHMIFDEEADLSGRTSDLPVRLFLGVGALEDADVDLFLPVTNLQMMDTTLRGRSYPNLKIAHRVFPDENHMSVYPIALSHGLRAVFK
jgi:predicted alpha/beta superfamily hydrolase